MNHFPDPFQPNAALTVLIALLLSFAATAFAQSPSMTDISHPNQNPYVIGHRGAAGLLPENTLAGFKKACEIGVDGIELDVLITADGELVVYHDYALNPDITRTEDGNWLDPFVQLVVKELSLSRIKRFDVGRLQAHTPYSARYPEQKAADGEHIPTFREVASLFKQSCGPSTKLFVEIKTSPEQPDATPSPELVCDKTIEIIREEELTDRAWILSFDWRNLLYVQNSAPELTTVYLTIIASKFNTLKPGQPNGSPWLAGMDIDDFGGSAPRTVKAAGGSVWSPYFRNLTPGLLAEAHDLGLLVSVWTPDDPTQMEKLIGMGVDAITTNRPDLLKNLLK